MTATHNLIKRITKNPLGTRVRMRCQTCRDHMPHHGDWFDASMWVQQHVGINKAAADQMVRTAGRWDV